MEPGKKGGAIGSELMANKVTGGDVRKHRGGCSDGWRRCICRRRGNPRRRILPTSTVDKHHVTPHLRQEHAAPRIIPLTSATMHGALLSAANAATVVASAVENDPPRHLSLLYHCASCWSSWTDLC
ncbi:hypothetical protein SESBI_17180 [Sesbania bispinosa]|nr:hypothetical protein SESBI_17180 [Sesbania bispinosa]